MDEEMTAQEACFGEETAEAFEQEAAGEEMPGETGEDRETEADGAAGPAEEEMESLRAQAEVIGRCARQAGLDRGSYLAALEQRTEQEQVEMLAAQYGTTPDAARQILGYQREQQRQAELSPYMELLRRYPELMDPGQMPPEVAGSIRQGTNPVVAYQDYLLERRQAAESVGSRREALRARCPGSAAGCGDGEADGAFAAFDAALNGY